MPGIYLGNHWHPEKPGFVEALYLDFKPPYGELSTVTYDTNNPTDMESTFMCTGCAETVMMTAHSTLMRWGVEDKVVTDFGTLVAKRQANQHTIELALLQMGQNA